MLFGTFGAVGQHETYQHQTKKLDMTELEENFYIAQFSAARQRGRFSEKKNPREGKRKKHKKRRKKSLRSQTNFFSFTLSEIVFSLGFYILVGGDSIYSCLIGKTTSNFDRGEKSFFFFLCGNSA